MNGNPSTAPILIVHSFHHQNTLEVAEACAEVLGAEIKSPHDTDPAELADCNLVGFGSGIYHAKHSGALLTWAERLPQATGTAAFIFSTSGVYNPRKLVADHAALRDLLIQKGYTVVGEFGCRGWDTYAFLRYIGGLNRSRPNAVDLERARAFARGLKEHVDASDR